MRVDLKRRGKTSVGDLDPGPHVFWASWIRLQILPFSYKGVEQLERTEIMLAN